MEFPKVFKLTLLSLLGLFLVFYCQALFSIRTHPMVDLVLKLARENPEIVSAVGNNIERTGFPSLVVRQGGSGKVYLMRLKVCGTLGCRVIRARSKPVANGQIELKFVKLV